MATLPLNQSMQRAFARCSTGAVTGRKALTSAEEGEVGLAGVGRSSDGSSGRLGDGGAPRSASGSACPRCAARSFRS